MYRRRELSSTVMMPEMTSEIEDGSIDNLEWDMVF